LKILLVNWQDPENPRAGGAEIHLREVFGRIRASGHEVHWLASAWKGAPSSTVLDEIPIHRVGSRYFFAPAAMVHFRRYLATSHWDVVVEALNKVPVYTPLWSRHPVVLLVHHLFGTTAFQEAPLPIAALTWLQERPVARIYDDVAIQAISRSTADDLVTRGLDSKNIQVIYPGVDHDFFHPTSSPGRSPSPTFLSLGRLKRYKRVDLVLDAFAHVSAARKDARLIVAGRGDQEGPLKQRARSLGISGAVEFVGFVSEERKRDLLRSTWAQVFVSPKEGWGITNLEAAACGTPTIASDSPGLRESVARDRTGILVPHGDVEALAGAMKLLAADREHVERLGAAALVFARDFTWDLTAQRTAEHLSASIAGRTDRAA